MRPIDTGKKCFVFLLGILLSLEAMSQTPNLNNPSTKISKKAATKKSANAEVDANDPNGPSKVMSFENPSKKDLEPDFDARNETLTETTPDKALSWAVSIDSGLPSHIIDKSGNSPQTLRFNERSGVALELTVLSRPILSRQAFDLRYRVGLGLALYERKDQIVDSFSVSRKDNQNLYFLPISLAIEASHRYHFGLSPTLSLGLAPAVAVASSSVLQDSKASIGVSYRVAAGLRQEFLGSNSLMLELSMNWNKILSESPNGLGLRVGFQRPF